MWVSLVDARFRSRVARRAHASRSKAVILKSSTLSNVFKVRPWSLGLEFSKSFQRNRTGKASASVVTLVTRNEMSSLSVLVIIWYGDPEAGKDELTEWLPGKLQFGCQIATNKRRPNREGFGECPLSYSLKSGLPAPFLLDQDRSM